MTNDILIGFVLDRSGSMAPLVPSTIEGFNTFIDEQRNQPGTARLSLTLFDTHFDTRYIATPLHNVPRMGHVGPNSYIVGGGTALLDAVGSTVRGIEAWQSNHGVDTPVKIVTLTDGEENSSHHWHICHPRDRQDKNDLINLIEYKQGEGWEFLFLGAGGSQWLEKSFGQIVPREAFYTFTASAGGTAEAYRGLANATSTSRNTGTTIGSHMPKSTP